MKSILLVTLGLLLVFTSGTSISVTEKLDQIVERYHQDGYYNGTILVADKNGTLLKKAYGMADFGKKRPLETSSTFYMASVSKQFTAMAIMLLKERKLLTIDDKLSTYFPSFPDWAHSVTIRHLLTHTSGIPDYYGLGASRPGFTNTDVVEVVKGIKALRFTPGAKYEYSNTAYVLLSSIVQQISGMGFNSFMQENVFQPIGMKSTVAYDETKPQRTNRCKGFDANGKEDDYPFFTTGGGGLYSNVDDMYQWHLALQTNKLVSAAAMSEVYSPMILNDGSTSWYGFGWALNKDAPASVSHGGTLTSFRTYIDRDLATGSVIIMLNNVGKTKRDELLAEIKALMKTGESNH